MRLSQFILSNMEPILIEWESFASSILPDRTFTKLALRELAEDILKAIATDMQTRQTALEQAEKSKGRGQRSPEDTAAETHAFGRLVLGFNQAQMVSEYRALRATVIRLWIESSPDLDESAIYELIRFNEGIDQALSESTVRFMDRVNESRDFAVAVMAHDLRNPLNAILTSGQLLQRMKEPEITEINELALTISLSATRMNNLIENLLDFTRTRLGQPLPLNSNVIDLAPLCKEVVGEFIAFRAKRTIRLYSKGDLRGKFDPARMKQMLSNLISNALEHGGQSTGVTVNAQGQTEQVVLEVNNQGRVISESEMAALLDPFSRFHKQDQASSKRRLGLGLAIAQEIVHAHSGKLNVRSNTDEGTTFVVQLPRVAVDN